MAHVLYLADLLTDRGLTVHGARLVEHLQRTHEVDVAGMVVPDGHELLQGALARLVVAESRAIDFDAIVLEGGWQPWGPDQARLRLEVADRFVYAGGQLLVCDLGRSEAKDYRDNLVAAGLVLGAAPAYHAELGLEYLHDDLAADPASRALWFYPEEMDVADWLLPALHGVERLLVSQPIHLRSKDGVAASGSSSTELLADDHFVARGVQAPWASVTGYGRGNAALVGGQVTPDPIVEANPGNAVWIGNLLGLMLDRVAGSV